MNAVPPAFASTFAAALRDPERFVPQTVIAENDTAAARRFAVHRNNVVAGLTEALRSRFPAAEKIVGEEFFAAMARLYVVQHPPHSPILSGYGDEFPAFVAAFEPAREVAYLADVARLEAARTRAFHAADASPVDLARFAALDPETLAGMRVVLHPSAEIIRSAHPVVTIWAMNSGRRTLAPIEPWCGEDALAVRPELDVEVRVLPPGGAAFLLALAAGRPLGDAARAAFADHPEFDLTRSLADLMSGIATGIATAPEHAGNGAP